jgi:crossover junction endodeoxyribonuclease RuvC
MEKTRIIIGVDPGLRATGFAVLELGNDGFRLAEAGDIKPPLRQPLPARLNKLFAALEATLQKWRPQAMALEKVYSEALFPHTAIVMGHVRGIICLAAERAGVELVEFPPTEIKKALTGFGRASKEQMGGAVARLLGLSEPPKSEHTADALALAAVAALRATTKKPRIASD